MVKIIVKKLRGERENFQFEGTGALLSEVNSRLIFHILYAKKLNSLGCLEVDKIHKLNKREKRGEISILRVVGSNFPKNTPGECSIDDAYQV